MAKYFDLLVDDKILKRAGFVNFFVVVVIQPLRIGLFLRHGQRERVIPNPAQVLHVIKKTSFATT